MATTDALTGSWYGSPAGNTTAGTTWHSSIDFYGVGVVSSPYLDNQRLYFVNAFDLLSGSMCVDPDLYIDEGL